MCQPYATTDSVSGGNFSPNLNAKNEKHIFNKRFGEFFRESTFLRQSEIKAKSN